MTNHKMILKPDALYYCDNGAVYCGDHCGYSARFNGVDVSGQEVIEVSEDDQKFAEQNFGGRICCEECR